MACPQHPIAELDPAVPLAFHRPEILAGVVVTPGAAPVAAARTTPCPMVVRAAEVADATGAPVGGTVWTAVFNTAHRALIRTRGEAAR